MNKYAIFTYSTAEQSSYLYVLRYWIPYLKYCLTNVEIRGRTYRVVIQWNPVLPAPGQRLFFLIQLMCLVKKALWACVHQTVFSTGATLILRSLACDTAWCHPRPRPHSFLVGPAVSFAFTFYACLLCPHFYINSRRSIFSILNTVTHESSSPSCSSN